MHVHIFKENQEDTVVSKQRNSNILAAPLTKRPHYKLQHQGLKRQQRKVGSHIDLFYIYTTSPHLGKVIKGKGHRPLQQLQKKLVFKESK